MTTQFLRTLTAAVATVIIGAATLTAPAMAGGQVSVSYSPSDPGEAKALGFGLQMFSLMKGMKANGANVSQNGHGNSAGGSQNGSGNNGVVVQEGNGHHGTIHQNGNNNSCGLFQFGENTNAQCAQNGNGQSSITTVFGF